MTQRLTAKERKAGYVRPLRVAYQHTACGQQSRLSFEVAERHAREPGHVDRIFCMHCRDFFPSTEFTWLPASRTRKRVGA